MSTSARAVRASLMRAASAGFASSPISPGSHLATLALLIRREPAAVAVARRARPARASSGGTSAHFENSCGQRGRKWQPSGRSASEGGRPGDRRQPLRSRPVHARDRPEQPPRVRVLRVVEDLVERPLLDDPAGVHDGDPVRDVGHHAEVVGHEDHRRAGLVAQLAHALEDLRLDRHIERRRGLVGDQDRRVAGQRQRDHHALAHAARELERVVVDALARARDADPLEQLDGPLARLLVGQRLVLLDLLDDLVARS